MLSLLFLIAVRGGPFVGVRMFCWRLCEVSHWSTLRHGGR